MHPERMLITYPGGEALVAETRPWDKGEIWIRGHGSMKELIEQQGCTIVPLLTMTPELIAAVRTLWVVAENELYSYARTEMETEIIEALKTWRQVLIELGEVDPDDNDEEEEPMTGDTAPD